MLPATHGRPRRSPGDRRVIGGLLTILGAAGGHQGRFTPQHPVGPQFDVRPEVGLVPQKIWRPGLGLAPEPRRSRRRRPASRLGLQPLFLGALEDEAETVQVVEQLLRLNTWPKRSWTNCRTTFHPVGQGHPSLGRCLHRRLQCRLFAGSRAGGTAALLEGQTCRPAGQLFTRAPMVWASRSTPRPLGWPTSPGPATRPHASAPVPRCGCAVHTLPRRLDVPANVRAS